jgi:hypothetical protein
MFIFSKKIFLKTIREPLRVRTTDKNVRFTGFTEEKLKKIMSNADEWAVLTRKAGRDKYIGVIPYLAGSFFFTDLVINWLQMLS